MTQFEFITPARIVFGSGKLQEITSLVQDYGTRAFVITDDVENRAGTLVNLLAESSIDCEFFTVTSEPSVRSVQAGCAAFQQSDCQFVIAIGGGSVIDTGKAVAVLVNNSGNPLDYLEVIGKGQAITNPPVPYIAIPTTAGTGAEVTKNAVLLSEEHQVKVSLRSPLMLPRVALVDPELTHSVPPAVTASTGMDALTQVIEPYVSILSNSLTDAIALEGIKRGSRSLRKAYQDGSDAAAREDMALTSLFGGLALANSKLGAVHGFAGVLGGMYHAPHGAVCARLLPPVIATNVQALQSREPDNPLLGRFTEVATIVTQNPNASVADLVEWVAQLGEDLNIPPLANYGVQQDQFAEIVEKSARSSSMKGNPILLTESELSDILQQAL